LFAGCDSDGSTVGGAVAPPPVAFVVEGAGGIAAPVPAATAAAVAAALEEAGVPSPPPPLPTLEAALGGLISNKINKVNQLLAVMLRQGKGGNERSNKRGKAKVGPEKGKVVLASREHEKTLSRQPATWGDPTKLCSC